MGKPSSSVLRDSIPEDHKGIKPHTDTLNAWVGGWLDRANHLDEQVNYQLDKRLIQEKVDMLRRHTVVAENMQNMAVEQFESHKDDLDYITANTALRMLTEGIRIERESRGIPGMLEKMASKDDEAILDDIKKLVKKSTEAGGDTVNIIDLEISDIEDSELEDSD